MSQRLKNLTPPRLSVSAPRQAEEASVSRVVKGGSEIQSHPRAPESATGAMIVHSSENAIDRLAVDRAEDEGMTRPPDTDTS
jgi:hypothetical protein